MENSMVCIDYFVDGKTGEKHKYIVSDKKFETLHLTVEGEEKPHRFAVRLTQEMEDCITQDWEA
jgi:hypothetical protein